MRQAAGLAIALILGFHAGPSRAAVASQVQVDVDFLSTGANYGRSVAIFEDVLAVGAPRQEVVPDGEVGAVMLFRRVGNSNAWDFWTTVMAPDLSDGYNFGNTVALHDKFLMVGSEGAGQLPLLAAGQGYVFILDPVGGSVTPAPTLIPLGLALFDQWGSSIAIGSDFAFLGSESAHMLSGVGEIQVYEPSGVGASTTWSYAESIFGDAIADHRFGSALATTPDGLRLLVGADNNGAGVDAKAYVFDYDQGSAGFLLTTTLSLPNAESADNFGTSVAISADGSTAVVGASTGNLTDGAAYVFDIDGGGAPVTLADPEGEPLDEFGFSVAIEGDVIAVGAEENSDLALRAGAVLLFGRDVGGLNNWGLIEQVNATDPNGGARYGTALSLQGGHLAVGARLWADPPDLFGSAYVVELPEPASALASGVALGMLAVLVRRKTPIRAEKPTKATETSAVVDRISGI
jgi:hypothetical protein